MQKLDKMVAKMGRTIGKFFLFWIIVCTFSLSAHIRLNIQNADGIATETIAAGQPFVIEATIEGVKGSVQAPTIAGLDQFFSKRTGMYMSTINGVSMTKYTYQARIDHPGSYHIGPARVMHQQKELA